MAKILVVDDDPMNLELVCEFLTERGHDVVRSTEGTAAAALAALHRPELALLDYQMQGIRGTEVLAQMRARPQTQRLPVVFLSGMPALRYSAEVPADDRVRFLHKPVDFQLLSVTIDDLTRLPR